MENNEKKLIELEEKINNIYISVEKTRKYFLWTMIITIVLFVLPIIGIIFILPSFLNTYLSNFNSLSL
jgi:type IV secretory pathway component VirB8